MTRMLDIIQDYQFELLSSRTKMWFRQPATDRFNEPGSKDFVFMLCTKTGDLGINLNVADTAFICVSD